MRPILNRQSALRAPLNDILGTEANVRLLRALAATAAPMSPSRLAEATGLHLSGSPARWRRWRSRGSSSSWERGRDAR
ncbi:MAG: hypothetical protein IPK33_13275 [Gemmatimonadetes bacterium]|nr:hypothetical protein [Gemmatimonadota bacterium]